MRLRLRKTRHNTHHLPDAPVVPTSYPKGTNPTLPPLTPVELQEKLDSAVTSDEWALFGMAPPLVKECDPDLEALLAEEERIEREHRLVHEATARRSPGRIPGSKNLTPEDPRVQERLNLWRQGMSYDSIAQQLHLSPTSVRNSIRKFATNWDRGVRERNIARRKTIAAGAKPDAPARRWVPTEQQAWYVDAIDTWAAGSTLRTVADAYGVTRERIRRVVNEFATDEQRAERERSLLAIRYLLDLKIEERNQAWQVEALNRKRSEKVKRVLKQRASDMELIEAFRGWADAWRAAHPGDTPTVKGIMDWAKVTDPHSAHRRMQTAASMYFAIGRWGFETPDDFLDSLGIPNQGKKQRTDSTPYPHCSLWVDRFLSAGLTHSYQWDAWRRTQPEPKPPTRAVIEKQMGDRLSNILEYRHSLLSQRGE